MKIKKFTVKKYSMQFVAFIFIMHEGILSGQVPDTVTLPDCHRSAIETHPLQGQKALFQQSKELKQVNHRTNWLPAVDLNGQYTWQNEVVKIPFPASIPGFETPAMPQYNYKLTLDVKQTLYDGGMNRKARELEEAVFEVNSQQVEVSLNRLKSQVNKVYFYILILQQQQKTMQIKSEELEKRLSVMESLVRNEAMLSSELNVLKAEGLKVDQQLAEIEVSRKSAIAVLGDLTSLETSDETVLSIPETAADPAMEPELPEHILYDLQIRNLDASIGLKQRQRYPKAFVFGQFGYGNPALNFFRDEFRGYYIMGAGLQWKIWDWSKTSREKQVLSIQKDIIRTRKESFDKNLTIELEDLMSAIIKYKEAVRRDKEILKLREEITLTAGSKLENGLITSTEYITSLNAETHARIQLNMHRIQLEQARINYLTSKGIIY